MDFFEKIGLGSPPQAPFVGAKALTWENKPGEKYVKSVT